MSYKALKSVGIPRLFSKSIKNSDIKLLAREFRFISTVDTLKEQSLTSLFFFFWNYWAFVSPADFK